MARKKTREKFIEDAIKVHGDKYCYDLVDYKNSATKVIIICPIHGEFSQKPNGHLNGYGCKGCSDDNQNCSTDDFIIKAKVKHGSKYCYDLVEYKNNETKVIIICPEHGEFSQQPNNHLSGDGCSKCSGKYQYTTEEWIVEARKKHGDKYCYDLVDYKNTKTKVIIICPYHDEFKQTPKNHLKGRGCPKCCNGQPSKGEIEMREYIYSIYNGTVKPNHTGAIGRFEIDTYLPKLSIAFEFNGTNTHADRRFYDFGQTCAWNREVMDVWARDERKARICKKKKIKLITIWEYDWIHNREYCERIIYNAIYPSHRRARNAQSTINN